MTEVLQLVAVLVAAAALVSGLAVLAGTRHPVTALGVMLDLLLAAGLLRLAAVDDWRGILAAAAIVAVRKVVTTAYRRGARTLQPAQ